jgi:hypothetical protein
VEQVSIGAISPDTTFRLREPDDVTGLATAIGRLGQLEPVDVRPMPGEEGRFQLLSGFRRMEALRLLQRERVLARVHPALPDGEAWAVALAGILFAEPPRPADLDAAEEPVRKHLPWALPVLEARRKAAGKAPAASNEPAPAAKAPPVPAAAPGAATPGTSPAALPGRLPADPAALAHALASRAYDLNGDVAAVFERWRTLPPEARRLVLDQLRWIARVVPILEKEIR